jgi:hypothetical protein
LNGNDTIGGIMNVWNIKGDSNNARFLQSPQINSGLFNVDTILQNDAVWLTSINVNSLVGAPNKTAFEAGLQEQTKLKAISECVREFDFWYRDMARQRMANIQFFMPTTTGKRILGEDNKDKYRKIALEDKKMKKLYKVGKKGQLEEAGVSFEENEGKAIMFELKPEILRNNLDVSIETPTTTPILRDIRNHEVAELIQVLLQTAQTPQGQEILKRVDFMKLIERQFSDKGYDSDEFIKEEVDEDGKKEQLFQKIMSKIPQPPRVDQPMSPSPVDAMIAQVMQNKSNQTQNAQTVSK